MTTNNNTEPVLKHLFQGEWVQFYLTTREGTPNYQYYFKITNPITGKKKKYRGTTKSSNLEMAIEYLENVWFDIKSGQFFEKETRKSQGLSPDFITFEEVMKKFIDNKFKTSRTLTQKTKIDYERSAENLIRFFGPLNIEKVGKRHLYREYQKLRTQESFTDDGKVFFYNKKGKKIVRSLPSHVEPENYGKVVVNREMELFFQCLKWGTTEYRLFKEDTIDTFEWHTERRNDVYIEEEEYNRLKEYFAVKNPYYLKIIRFLVHTGLRPNELFKLTWDCVNFDKQYIEVKDRKNPIKGAKRKETIINTSVPIVGVAEQILKELRSRDIYTDKFNHVFVNDKGEHVTRIEKAFKTALRECDIKKNVTLNVFRHQAATRFIKKGYSATFTRQILGHSPNSRVLENVYLHLDSRDLVNKAKELEEDLNLPNT